MRRYVRRYYSPTVRVLMAAILAVLLAILGYIICLEVKQINSECTAARQEQAVQTPELTETAQNEAQQSDAQAEKARLEQEERERQAREQAAEAAQYSFYQKLAHGYDVKLLILGDACISGAGASTDAAAWYSLLENHLAQTYLNASGAKEEIINRAGEGHTAIGDYAAIKQADGEEDFDLVVLCYGQGETEQDFGVYFEALVRALRDKYPDCAMISVLEASSGGYTGKMQAMQQVCAHYAIPVADTYALCAEDTDGTGAELPTDSVSPNDRGHELYFQAISEIIDGNVADGTGKPEKTDVFDRAAAVFDTLLYVPAAELERRDDLTFAYTGGGANGALLLCCGYPVTKENCKVIADEILYNLPNTAPARNEDGSCILAVSRELTLNSELKLVFSDKDSADGLKGIYLVGAQDAV